MTTETTYIATLSLDEYFVDKTTGLPLVGGQIFFWHDTNRANLKAIYTISGSPPNYTYIPLPNPLSLSAVGTPVDLAGNNVAIYYYPYDAEGGVDLYYVEVFDSQGVRQFTREGWPPGIAGQVTPSVGADVINYIPNGQFIAHNNIAANPLLNTPAGRITQSITNIAQGGWTFERPISTTSVDNVTFFRYGSYVTVPTGSPRYAVQVNCLGPNPSDAFKYLAITFQDVNKFASDSQNYTFSFNAITAGSSNFDVNVDVIKNFGTGGSASTTTVVDIFTITNVQQIFNTSFVFGNNAGQTIGLLDDDYVKIVIAFPTNISFNAIFTDFVLTIGNVNITVFPVTTDDQFMVNSLAPPPNDYNGLDIGLPLVLTTEGLAYDTSVVGKVSAYVGLTAPAYHSLCDGTSFFAAGYSPEGIPYSRLQSLFFGPVNMSTFIFQPLFGTGVNYVTATPSTLDTVSLLLATNKPGMQTLTADGINPTGFQFNSNFLGRATLGLAGNIYGTGNQFWCANISNGLRTIFDSTNTSGFTLNNPILYEQGERWGTSVLEQRSGITIPALPSPGTCIQFSGAGGPAVTYRFWFKVDGVGTDPGGTGTPIEVDLQSTMSTADCAIAMANVISANQMMNIRFSPGSAITPNAYFTFYANGQLYYVWYALHGIGTDPALAGGIGIPVPYETTTSAQQIRDSTGFAINGLYFAVPDLRGIHIKGYDPTGLIDGNYNFRYSFLSSLLTSSVGSFQYDYGLSILTKGAITGGSYLALSGGSPAGTSGTYFGTAENDVKNMYLNYIIRY